MSKSENNFSSCHIQDIFFVKIANAIVPGNDICYVSFLYCTDNERRDMRWKQRRVVRPCSYKNVTRQNWYARLIELQSIALNVKNININREHCRASMKSTFLKWLCSILPSVSTQKLTDPLPTTSTVDLSPKVSLVARFKYGKAFFIGVILDEALSSITRVVWVQIEQSCVLFQ